ncbi:MAG: hypothetical protein AAFN81_35460, partial [Bacteroidota bacterium]
NTATGCSTIAEAVVDVQVDQDIQVDAGSYTFADCEPADVDLNPSIVGDFATATWETSGDGTFSPSANDLNATYVFGPNDLALGGTTLTLRVTSTLCAAEFTDNVDVSFDICPPCVPPSAMISAEAGTCTGSTPNDDATITLSAILDADEAGIVAGTDYDADGGLPYGGAMNTAITGTDLMFTGLVHNTDYVVRVFNGNNGCFTDFPITTPERTLPTVTMTLAADLSICVNVGVQTGLDGGTPTGGVYSGIGITDDGNGMTFSIDPAVAGVGTTTITYTFTDANGCTNSASDDIDICGADYGDLPDSYGTTEGNSGPSHGIDEDLYLGSCVDEESDGNPDSMAGMMTGGDDNTTG